MKSLFLFVFLFSLPYGAARAFQVNNTPEETIRRIIDSGLFEGHDQKLIGGLGDAAAVAVTKEVADSKLTPNQIDSILLILNSAFADIGADQNREPRTALFVLRDLELLTGDAALRKRIEATRMYILGQVAKSKQGHTPK
jgi:hypothetical protein